MRSSAGAAADAHRDRRRWKDPAGAGARTLRGIARRRSVRRARARARPALVGGSCGRVRFAPLPGQAPRMRCRLRPFPRAAARPRQLRTHAASAPLAERCSARPGVALLATSREPLRLPAETVFRVPSLDLPDPERACRRSCGIRVGESVRRRGRRRRRGFTLDEGNAADVVRICFRLDGLPLALELAAGRIGALTPAAIAARLDDRFALLRTGSHAGRRGSRRSKRRSNGRMICSIPRRQCCSGDSRSSAAGSSWRRSSGCRRRSARAGRGGQLARLVEKSLTAVDDTARPADTVCSRRWLYARDRLAAAGEAGARCGTQAGLCCWRNGSVGSGARPDSGNLRAASRFLLDRAARRAADVRCARALLGAPNRARGG